MAKVKIKTWFSVEVNNRYYQYFYKHEGFDRNGNSKYRVFILDEDSRVYESILKCYEHEIEDDVISFCECEL